MRGEQVKEHPILFNAEMVRAILAGRKTQTRRVIMPQPVKVDGPLGDYGWQSGKRFYSSAFESSDRNFAEHCNIRCPYGQPGDRLWVRETWLQLDADHRNPEPDRGPAEGDRGIVYKASYDPITDHRGEEIRREYGYRWRPSIHMPRWASRITLEVVSARIERVQSISATDSAAEGVGDVGLEERQQHGWSCGAASIARFRSLWDSINKKRGYGWDANPWVWVIEFKQIERNE